MNNVEFDTLIENNIEELFSSFEYDYRRIIRNGLKWDYNVLFIRFHRCLTVKDNTENQRRFSKLRECLNNILNINEDTKIFFIYKDVSENRQISLYNDKLIEGFLLARQDDTINILEWKQRIPNLNNEAKILINI